MEPLRNRQVRFYSFLVLYIGGGSWFCIDGGFEPLLFTLPFLINLVYEFVYKPKLQAEELEGRNLKGVRDIASSFGIDTKNKKIGVLKVEVLDKIKPNKSLTIFKILIATVLIFPIWYFFSSSNNVEVSQDLKSGNDFDFSKSGDSLKILILRFEDYISKEDVNWLGQSLYVYLDNIKTNYDLPISVYYDSFIKSPFEKFKVESILKDREADIVIYGLANQVKQNWTKGNVCFRYLVGDTIMGNIPITGFEIAKSKHDLEYVETNPFEIEQGLVSINHQQLLLWVSTWLAHNRRYLEEINNLLIKHYKDVISKGDSIETPSFWLKKAFVNFKSSNYSYAASDFEKVTQFNVKDKGFYYMMKGYCYSFLGKDEKAIESYSYIIDNIFRDSTIIAHSITALFYRSLHYKNLGLFKEAINDCDLGNKLNKINPMFYERKGDILYLLGRNKEAIKSYSNSIQRYSLNPALYYKRGLIYAGLDSTKLAILDLSKVIELELDSIIIVDCYYNRGILYRKLGLYDMSIEDFNNGLKLNPKDTGIIYNRGLTLYNKGNLKNAKQDFESSKYSDEHYNNSLIYLNKIDSD